MDFLYHYPELCAIPVIYLFLAVWFFMAKSSITTPEHARSYTVDASEMVLTPHCTSEYAG